MGNMYPFADWEIVRDVEVAKAGLGLLYVGPEESGAIATQSAKPSGFHRGQRGPCAGRDREKDPILHGVVAAGQIDILRVG